MVYFFARQTPHQSEAEPNQRPSLELLAEVGNLRERRRTTPSGSPHLGLRTYLSVLSRRRQLHPSEGLPFGAH